MLEISLVTHLHNIEMHTVTENIYKYLYSLVIEHMLIFLASVSCEGIEVMITHLQQAFLASRILFSNTILQ